MNNSDNLIDIEKRNNKRGNESLNLNFKKDKDKDTYNEKNLIYESVMKKKTISENVQMIFDVQKYYHNYFPHNNLEIVLENLEKNHFDKYLKTMKRFHFYIIKSFNFFNFNDKF